MKTLKWVTALCALVGAVSTSEGRSRESFNADWRFERFGPMPDGSSRPEPDAAGWAIVVTASSQEIERGNPAENALDGDPNTRWCADNKNQKQWLKLDLGTAQKISRALVQWEFPAKKYEFTVEGSSDGQAWQLLPGTVRFVRIQTTKLPDAKWASIREVQLFDDSGKEIKNQRLATSGAPSVAAFDDSAWRKLVVPHDWGVEGPFRADLDNNTGKLPWKGIGWYRKHFTVPAEDQGKRIFIDFDGAMANAQVWLNGELVGGWPYGYQPFRVDLTDKVKFGGENVIAVRLDTAHWGSRWYPGAGLYRNVWLVKTAPVHVAHWGVFVATTVATKEKCGADVSLIIDNQGDKECVFDYQATLFEMKPDGTPDLSRPSTAGAGKDLKVGPGSSFITKNRFEQLGRGVKPWDLESPNMYVLRITISVGGKVVDVYDQPFGFRTIEFMAREGFKLNGKRVQLNGTCNHHDLGPLGAAFNTRALERQFAILKEMGCNALRTSHNPPAPEFCELADRIGLLVQCEAFDCWRGGKTANDYSTLFDAWHEKDLQAMVRRERNHPSVIMWSIGNEIHEQRGPELAKPLADIIRREDPTRPVTAGCNNAGAGRNGFQTAVDVFGLNYHTGDYGKLLAHPGNEKKPFHSSESSSCISSRGEYFFPVKRGADSRVNFQVSSYDVDAPGWACDPDTEFAALDKYPAFAGEFVWTGFDYLGEPTPYNNDVSNLLNFSDPKQKEAMQKELTALGKLKVPSASSYFGIIDLCGFKKDRFFLYQARWRPELPMAHILPHWNWSERVGQVTPVHVYTSGDAAELFLNGKSLGKKTKGEFEYRLRWDDVVYQPGELKVIAYKKGKEWATDVVKTTSAAEQLKLAVDRAEIRGDGRDLAYITVTIADKDGLLVPRTHNLVKFSVSGPGEIVAVGNGDAASHEPFIAQQRRAFNGLCLAIVRAKRGTTGEIRLAAESDGLRRADITILARE